MEILLYIIVGLLIAYMIYARIRDHIRMKKALSLVFLRVIIPKKESDLDEKKESTGANTTFKDVVSVMEQFLASIHEIEGGGYISLEYAVIKEQVHFYLVVPFELQELIEKQLTSYYPDAIIEVEDDYNIFSEDSVQQAVTLKMKKSYTYPIKTYQQLESDPMNNIANSLSKLSADEGALVQIMIKPIPDKWWATKWQEKTKKLAERIYSGKKKVSLNPMKMIGDLVDLFSPSGSTNSPQEPTKLTPLMEEVVKAIESKSHKVGFETIIRIVTSAPTRMQAKNQIQSIMSSFVQFRHPQLNNVEKAKYCSSKKSLNYAIYRLFKKTHLWIPRMILSTDELSSLYHPPHHKYNKSDNIAWQKFKISPPPENLPKEGLLIGHTKYRGQVKEVRLKTEDRFRHVYVIGQTGTGKSSIVQTMVKQDLKKEGLCIVDPHGDLVKDLLPFVPRERADDVIIFSPADTERPLGLNILEARDDDEMELVTGDVTNIMIKLFGNEIFGPRIQDYFRNGVMTLMSDPEGGALTDIVNLFVNEEFQKKKRAHLRNAVVRSWWDHTYDSMGDREKQEIIPYFAAKFGQFITNGTIRNIIGQTKSAFDFSDAMQEGKLIFMDLSKGLVGDLNSQLLGMIVVSKIQVAAMRRQKMAKSERKNFFLYIDEFQNYVTDAIESILSEARKYRLGLVIAHQYIDQLEKKDLGGEVKLKGAIFGNVGNVLSMKIGEIDAEFMAKVFAPVFSEQDIANMDAFKAIMKLSIDLQPSRPFSLSLQKPWEMMDFKADEEAAEAFRQLSRLKYGRQKEFIDQEIRYRMGAM